MKTLIREFMEDFKEEIKEEIEYAIKKKRKSHREVTTSDLIEMRNEQARDTQQFLDIVRSAVKGCEYFRAIPSVYEKSFLWYNLYKGNRTIGFVDGMDYLLDCEYIYKILAKRSKNSEIIPDRNIYFWNLFRMGILKMYKPYSLYYITEIEGVRRIFFRIPNALVNFDIDRLNPI